MAWFIQTSEIVTGLETLLNSETKSATFNSPSVDTLKTSIVGFGVTTANQSTLNCDLQLQGSFDDVNWVNVGSSVNVLTDTTEALTTTSNAYPYLRVNVDITAGSADFTVIVHAKG